MPVGTPVVAPGSHWSAKSVEEFTSSTAAVAGKGVSTVWGMWGSSIPIPPRSKRDYTELRALCYCILPPPAKRRILPSKVVFA